jgi:hypothetical protein
VVPRVIDDREEQVADLGGAFAGRGRAVDLGQLLVDLGAWP